MTRASQTVNGTHLFKERERVAAITQTTNANVNIYDVGTRYYDLIRLRELINQRGATGDGDDGSLRSIFSHSRRARERNARNTLTKKKHKKIHFRSWFSIAAYG